MNKRIHYLVSYILLAILIFVVVYYKNSVEKWTSIRERSKTTTYQPVTVNPLLSSEIIDKPTTSCVTGRPCTYLDQVDLRVIVITFNRPDSLSKLLRSLDTLPAWYSMGTEPL